MNSPMDKKRNILEVNERAFDLLAEMQIQAEVDAVLADITASDTQGMPAEERESLERLNARNLKAIQSYYQKAKLKRFFRKTVPRFVSRAAMVVGIIAFAGTVAIASSRTVRIRVMQLLYAVEEEYTTVTLQENEAAAFEVPADWEGSYFPTFIPDDLTLTSVFSDEEISIADWSDATGRARLHFTEASETINANVDTEDAVVDDFESGEKVEGRIITKDGSTTIMWRTFDRYYSVFVCDIDQETAIKIVEGLQRLK